MTDLELKQHIQKLDMKIDRLKPSDERIVYAYKAMIKRRKALITTGCSEETLKVVNYMIQQIEPIGNTLIKLKERLEVIEAEQRAREAAKREKEYLDAQLAKQSNPFNMKCFHFLISDGEPKCEVKMDMDFCSEKCPYATNNRGHYKVDKNGNVQTHYYRMENGKWKMV